MSLENKEGNPLFGKDFLKTWYLADDEIKTVADVAGRLAALQQKFLTAAPQLRLPTAAKKPELSLRQGLAAPFRGFRSLKKTEGILPIPQRWQPCLPRGAQML